MTGELKVFFGRKLQPKILGDLQPDLWASVQRLPLFKQLKLMVNLKSMTEKIKSEFQVLEGKPLPEILKSFVNKIHHIWRDTGCGGKFFSLSVC